MPDNSISAQLAALRQTVEALALEVALRDLNSPEQIKTWAPILVRIQQEAEAAGIPAVAASASTFAQQIERSDAALPSIGPALRDAISRMQQHLAEPEAAPSEPSAPLALNQDPELMADFLLESREHLSALETQLLALEQDPRNLEAINTIFRGFHTIKGLAGFLDFPVIQGFAHEVETLLDLARNFKLPVDSGFIDIILQSADYMRHCLRGVEAGIEPAARADPLIARILKITGAIGAGSGDSPSGLAELAVAVAAPLPVNAPEPAHAGSASQEAGADAPRAVKVDTAKLDYLVEMAGELVIAQSLIRHDPDMAAARSPRLARNLSQLTRITADVQRVAMAMRMIPVSQMFQRMSRLVRDLARKSGKQVQMELSGEDTELDRNMVEELSDPLMHMIRNAVDHGAEPPEARIAAGKSPTASVVLKAYHQGGFINIEISDDGRGLVRDKLLARARQRGLTSGAGELSDQEVFSFIFEPGFSTAEHVTDVSGRGVGMDVVRKQIAKLRGRVDISSRPGFGTTFVIKLPLTLAIIEGLVVGVGKERYVVPIFVVKEMFRPAAESLSALPGGREMALVRGSLLPILRLHILFGVAPRSKEQSSGILIVVESQRKSFCLLVDEVIGKQEVVIKSLGETFKHVIGVAGGSILGDGRVGLILDVEALFGDPSRQ